MSDIEDLCGEDIDWEVNNDIDWNVNDAIDDVSNKNAVPDVETPDQSFLDVLHKSFGHRVFRPMQWKIISTILEGRDVCAIMATGYGKSLCYQFPSVFCGGITLVISPLISLMEDQVLSLEMSNIPACLLGSAQTNKNAVINDILDDKYTIIYATPEFCLGDYGTSILQKMYSSLQINLLAIDEAHCVSQWGHDFRVQYRNLSKLRNILIDVPILAVTATATPSVQTDIVKSLRLNNPLELCSGFDRPNLYFEVRMRSTSDAYTDMKCFMINVKNKFCFPGSTIIYCLTKKNTDDVVQNLKQHGIKAGKYHAGLSIVKRKEAHEQFVKDKVKVIVATIAFGMGIDKPDVRTIIHYGASKDIEGYYQEVGRAGRDGLPSKCIVLYSTADFIIHRRLRESTGGTAVFKRHLEENSLIMEKYLNVSTCRRQFILEYFGEKITTGRKLTRNCCDNCTRLLMKPKIGNNLQGSDDSGLHDTTEDVRIFLQAVSALGGKFGIHMYILFIRGSKSAKLYTRYQKHPLHGKGKHMPDDWWKIIARLLSADEYLKKVFHKNPNQMSFVTVDISDKGKSFLLNPKAVYKVDPPEDMKKFIKKKQETTEEQPSTWKSSNNKPLPNVSLPASASTSVNVPPQSVESAAEKMYRMEVYKALLATRNDLAHSMDCMPYMIASNSALMQLAKSRPLTVAELKQESIDGLNEIKIQKFGKQFVDCIQQYRSEHEDPCKNANTDDKSGRVSSAKMDTEIKTMNDLKKFSFVERNIKVETPSTVDTSPQTSSNASQIKRFSFSERKNKLSQAYSQNDLNEVNKSNSTATSSETVIASQSSLESTHLNSTKNIGETGQIKKKFSFKKRLSLHNDANVSFRTNDETFCDVQSSSESKDPDTSVNHDTSFGWLDSPETKKESQVGKNTSKRPIDDDCSFLLDEDSFDNDLMSVVDNIENNITGKQENPATVKKSVNLQALKKKRIEPDDCWWAEKKKPKLHNYLDF